MTNKPLTIGKAAKYLGISVDTLRRWDKNGKLFAKKSKGGHRYYEELVLKSFKEDVFALATAWVLDAPSVPKQEFYCPTSSEFRGSLSKLQSSLGKVDELKDYYSLIVAVVGEIGNNSFDHNLGNWPDITGIYFSYDLGNRVIVLADRGQGILATLRRVRPALTNDGDALKVAFTETISGRFPEARGNGLKFVKSIIIAHPFTLYFQTGPAYLYLKQNSKYVVVRHAPVPIRGCFATIGF